ncbi:unnamed protein product [Cladocopium goreaui]|uniref:Interferon-inducible GTPase 5 n=1 Tax=Cladocopium goreaui TaxID=2562237 RepID=A0A9P1DH14_9DINO|nr:unnamed protein product [Cladocopium goreaui]
MTETSPGADEELRTWRIRALQAEAEVRSLKRTRPLQGESETSRPADTRRETSRVDFGMQTELVETVDEFHAEARERLRSSPVGSDSSPLSEIEELRQQLKQRDTAIVQLQADSHREHQSKQRKAVEQQQMYLEELREMTQRAESLMDQLRKSKKSGRELQAAREAARDEFLTARCELQECQAQLRRQVFVPSQSTEPSAGREEAEAALGDSAGEALDPWRGGKPTEDAVSRILQQMDKALLDGPPADGSRALGASLRLPPSSPEAERPVPEGNQLKITSSATSAASPQDQKDSDEVLLLKLDVNAVRVAAELEKEKLISEHCDQLDDLVKQHDKERRKLQNELTELRSKQLCSEAREKPLQEIRAHFEKQVAEVKYGLVAQIADIHEQKRMQNGQAEQEMALLKKDLERCQAELAASQQELRKLVLLYEKEQQELQDLRQQHSSGDSKTLILGESTG